MHGAFHDAPRTSDESIPLFDAGVLFPRRRPSCHPLTLPSPRSACPPCILHRACARAAFACRRRPPHPVVGDVCEHAVETTGCSLTRDGGAAVLMIQSAFHRTGNHSRLESCPSLRFASATPLRSPVAARVHDDDCRSSDFCHYEPIVSTTLSKGRFLASSGRPCGRTVCPAATNRRRTQLTFVTWKNDGWFSVAPVLVHRPSLRSADESERASRAVDDFPRSCERLPSPARAESPESKILPSLKKREESPYSTPSRASLGHRLRAQEFGERSQATNQPKTRPMFRAPRRVRTCERIEMLSIVHHSFARVRIAPRHARVEPGRPSSFLRREVARTGFSTPL